MLLFFIFNLLPAVRTPLVDGVKLPPALAGFDLGEQIAPLNHFSGKHHSKETKANISKAHIGKTLSEEHKAKIGKASKECWDNPEFKAKMSATRKGHLHHMYGKHHSKKTRAKISKAHIGINAGELNYMYGKHHSEKTKAKLSKAKRNLWQNPQYRGKFVRLWQDLTFKDKQIKVMRLGCQIHPNKPETALLALLKSIAPQWEYVGDGSLTIGGKNPDFWNGDHQLAELFGDYWHQGEDPEERITLFAQYGYDTLVIWESELKKPEKVLAKITRFTEQ